MRWIPLTFVLFKASGTMSSFPDLHELQGCIQHKRNCIAVFSESLHYAQGLYKGKTGSGSMFFVFDDIQKTQSYRTAVWAKDSPD
jgi:hypothetical protein